MAKKLKQGDEVNTYTVLEHMHSGGMALSYRARNRTGEIVFLKQYKSPSVRVDWYRGYVAYQEEIRRRIESSAARNFCYRFIDFFEAKAGAQTYFQVFEFVTGSEDMESILEKIREDPSHVSWNQRLTLAKVLMAGVASLHAAGVVHSDLKPPNIQLFPDPDILAGYRLKLIDMDFSILDDQEAPWRGYQGYVGSPGYFSPEHLGNSAPQPVSDTFTCALILYELLGNAHPYMAADEDGSYEDAVRAHAAARICLAGSMPAGNDDDVAEVLHRSLSPDPDMRPTARDINAVLNGMPISQRSSKEGGASDVVVGEPVGPSRPAPRPTSRPASRSAYRPAPPANKTLCLIGERGKPIRVRITTILGRALYKRFGSEARYVHPQQFKVKKNSRGYWVLCPNLKAVNKTLLNGEILERSVALREGDIIAIGSETKKDQVLPVRVTFE
jgi:serine/threonine protein kinase